MRSSLDGSCGAVAQQLIYEGLISGILLRSVTNDNKKQNEIK